MKNSYFPKQIRRVEFFTMFKNLKMSGWIKTAGFSDLVLHLFCCDLLFCCWLFILLKYMKNVVRKDRSVLTSFSYNCGYLLVLYQNSGSFFKVNCYRELETVSRNFLYCFIEIHWSVLHFEWLFNPCKNLTLLKGLEDPQGFQDHPLRTAVIEFGRGLKDESGPSLFSLE